MTWPTNVWCWDSRTATFILRHPNGKAYVWCDKGTGQWWTGKVQYAGDQGATKWLSSRRDRRHVQAQAEATLTTTHEGESA